MARANNKSYIILQQIYELLIAQISILDVLNILLKQNNKFYNILYNIKCELLNGQQLAFCINKYLKITDLELQLLLLGEKLGKTEYFLGKIIDTREKYRKLKNNILQASLYPILTLCATIFILLFLAHNILPKFHSLLHSTQRELPYLTEVVIYAANIIDNYSGKFFIFVFILSIIIYNLYKVSNKVQLFFDKLLLSLPTIRLYYHYRFCEILYINLASGIPILDALNNMQNILRNKYYQREIVYLYQHISDGHNLSALMGARKIYANIMKNFIMLGEHSGKLDDMLSKLAITFENRLNKQLKIIQTMVAPCLIVITGIIIAIIILATYMPLLYL
jgi:type II secretory pathway component PulF